MIIIDRHPFVFKHIKAMVEELCSVPKYDDVVLVLGYNVYPVSVLNDIKKQYGGKRIVVYNLEQMHDGSPWVNKNCISWLKGCDEVWDYNKNNILYLYKKFGIKAMYHPVKWVKCLKRIPKVDNVYDVLFYGEITPRRYKWLYDIQSKHRNLKMIMASGVTGDVLDELIAKSKIILNIHAFDNYTNQEIVRLFYPLINNKCVLSERSKDDSYAGDCVVYADVAQMGDKIVELLKNDKYLEIANGVSERYREHCFGN